MLNRMPMLESWSLIRVLILVTSVQCSIIKRQVNSDLLCCRCVDASVGCDLGMKVSKRVDGLTCKSKFTCFVATNSFEECDNCPGLQETSTQAQSTSGLSKDCDPGFVSCCSVAETGLVREIELRIGLVVPANPLGEATDNVLEELNVCNDDKIGAITNMQTGRVCGKRDSRVYKHVERPETFTNPGEWPWVAMLFNLEGEYLGAATYISKNTVVTVAHKVALYQSTPSSLRVRLGDWKPKEDAMEEVYAYEEFSVSCIKIHPKADTEDTLQNNVAVIKLNEKLDTAAERQNKITIKSIINLRRSDSDPPSYNTVCLPHASDQFKVDRCWVAAWGSSLARQREVDLPLLSSADCTIILRPVFREKGVAKWEPHSSEICAGGEVGKDSCAGEGGAPLVCLDTKKDQYYAVGLVSYGFGCNTTLPAVYTNLQDPTVNSFVKDGFRDDFC